MDPADLDRVLDPEASFFEVLGVKPTATAAELTAARRRLARLVHPDIWASSAPELRARASEAMAHVNLALQVLMEPSRRRPYLLVTLPRTHAPCAACAGLGVRPPTWRGFRAAQSLQPTECGACEGAAYVRKERSKP